MKITKENIDKVCDGLGLPIDPLIKPLVLALNEIGFYTECSCEGHIDWGRRYPFVDVIIEFVDQNSIDGLGAILNQIGWCYGYSICRTGQNEPYKLEIKPIGAKYQDGELTMQQLQIWQQSIPAVSSWIINRY